jgi:hypothetical protein
MNNAPSGVLVWKLGALNLSTASVRYRCLLPAGGLLDSGFQSLVVENADTGFELPHGARALIIVKSFSAKDIELAQTARSRGLPVIFDLCDNIFADGYAGKLGPGLRANFKRLCALADRVVVTNTYLADVLSNEVGADLEISIVPDALETSGVICRAIDHLIAARRAADGLNGSGGDNRFGRLYDQIKQLAERRPDSFREFDPAPLRRRARVLWFGNRGGRSRRTGIITLRDIAPELVKAYRGCEFDLEVCSNSILKYLIFIKNIKIPTSYSRWSLATIGDRIAGSDLVILPSRNHPFAFAKSSNRAVLALAQGTPVVASRIPALEPFEDCVIFDDWAGGIKTYLEDRELAQRHVLKAQELIAENYLPDVIARQWRDIFGALVKS